MKLISKIALGVGSAGTVAGTGLLIGNYYSGITIKEHIENNKKSKNKNFLTSTTPDLDAILAAYHGSKRTKPKDEKGNPIVKDKLVKWCQDAINNKFTDENSDDYKGIVSWCYINTKTLQEELSSNKKEILSGEPDTNQVWKDAWKEYKKDMANQQLKVTKAEYADLNQSDETKAGKAMHKWCKAIHDGNKKLYEDDAEKDYDRFTRWCSKDKE